MIHFTVYTFFNFSENPQIHKRVKSSNLGTKTLVILFEERMQLNVNKINCYVIACFSVGSYNCTALQTLTVVYYCSSVFVLGAYTTIDLHRLAQVLRNL